jgi:hypothetical protein
MTYAEQITDLVSNLGTLDEDPRGLEKRLSALGCRGWESRSGVSRPSDKQSTPAADEPCVTAALASILQHTSIDSTGLRFAHFRILDGLCQNSRWKQCLFSENLAYKLAAMLLQFSFSIEVVPSDFTTAMADDVHDVLTEWLHIEGERPGTPSMEQVAIAMFGRVWWDLVTLDGAGKTEMFKSIFKTVLVTRPPFLPDLLVKGTSPEPLTLPALDISL